MNHVSLVGHLADTPSYTPTAGDRPSRAAFSVGVPRRGSTDIDWIGVTAIGAHADALHIAGATAGAAAAVEGYLHSTSPSHDGRDHIGVVATHLEPLSPSSRPAESREASP